MDDLTKDQQFLLVSLYREYLNRQPALDPAEANYFVDSDSLIPLLGLDFSPEYVENMCLALLHKDYICGGVSEGSVDEFFISDTTIIYMENKFRNGIKSVIDFLAKFKPF